MRNSLTLRAPCYDVYKTVGARKVKKIIDCCFEFPWDKVAKNMADEIEKDINNSGTSPRKFKPPTLEEVQTYCKERNNKVDAETFIDHYTANGWIRGKTKIKDWKACVRTWEKSDKPQKKSGFDNFEKRTYDTASLKEKLLKKGRGEPL